jgi:micrococcal nuclease
VDRVVDGDTIDVRIGGSVERVRLLGIDTPESVKPGVAPECFSHEASHATATFLPQGTPVDLVRDVEARDKYGRLLAYVYRHADHTFVNLWLVQQGDAGLLTFPPNTAHAPQFEAATAKARAQHRGLWRACGAVHTRR